MLETASFMECGICNGDEAALKCAYNIEEQDFHHQEVPSERKHKGEDSAIYVKEDGQDYVKIYTDGSNQHGTQRELARAGWGVYYAAGSKHNIASMLHGPVQTSYRAEVRALLHAIQTSDIPVIIMIDCKGVVDTLNNYMETGQTGGKKL